MITEYWFDRNLQRFLDDLIQEINSTPSGHLRNLLTTLQINIMQIQDYRKRFQDQGVNL